MQRDVEVLVVLDRFGTHVAVLRNAHLPDGFLHHLALLVDDAVGAIHDQIDAEDRGILAWVGHTGKRLAKQAAIDVPGADVRGETFQGLALSDRHVFQHVRHNGTELANGFGPAASGRPSRILDALQYGGGPGIANRGADFQGNYVGPDG